MAPEGYELIKYNVSRAETWVLKDAEGNIWFPLTEIFRNVFYSPMNVTALSKKRLKHIIRLRMTVPRKNLRNVAPTAQPKDVVILADLWCVKNIIRSRFVLQQLDKYKVRDMRIEEFARHWGFSAIGYGVLTHHRPQWQLYPIVDRVAIAAEPNKELWMKCIECERYYPYTTNFYRKNNVTCNKCLGHGFRINPGGYYKINDHFTKGKRD